MVHFNHMEKRKPTFDLASFREAAKSPKRFYVTGTAIRTAASLGFDRMGMVELIQTMETKHFYKSMTANRDSKSWQDVYHVPSSVGVLYIKFTSGTVTEFTLLSFKEKNNE